MGAASGGLANDQNKSCICMLNENYRNDENNKWIMCSGCNGWCHHKCNLLSDIEYDEILISKKNWYCIDYQCQEKNETSRENYS